jgi:hypothetical protein
MVLKYSLPMGQPKIFIAKHEFLGKKKKGGKKKKNTLMIIHPQQVNTL